MEGAEGCSLCCVYLEHGGVRRKGRVQVLRRLCLSYVMLVRLTSTGTQRLVLDDELAFYLTLCSSQQ